MTVKRAVVRWLVVLAAVAVGASAYSRIARGTGPVDCPSERDPLLVVDSDKHALALCEGGKPVATFTVRLGKGGMGKSREGDEKTPTGRYGLGDARASTAYGLFLPIEYPTADQRRRGYTGGAIGVHGPDRRVVWLGALVNTFDTTDGCVGIATDDEMTKLAQWAREHRARGIVIR